MAQGSNLAFEHHVPFKTQRGILSRRQTLNQCCIHPLSSLGRHQTFACLMMLQGWQSQSINFVQNLSQVVAVIVVVATSNGRRDHSYR